MKKIIMVFTVMTVLSAQLLGAGERIPAKGFAAFSKEGKFQTYEFDRHTVGDDELLIDIMYAGICHSDLHAVWEDFRESTYPIVPGHEIAGRVVEVGKNVTKFKVGDYAGVGCMVNACGECPACRDGKEQFCEQGTVFTYNSPDRFHDGETTMGGYSNNIVISEKFVIKIPDSADMKRVAPLLCAGVTTWSPLHFSGVKKGDRVGIAGFGGLGHMGLQYAVDLGAEVTVFDISEEKGQDALRLGARRYVNVNNQDELEGLSGSFDFILSTIPLDYDPMLYVRMLKMGGELAVVGLPTQSRINIFDLVFNAQRKVYGSLIGGIKETQEMLDYSVAKGIYPEVEIIAPDGDAITQAYKDVQDGKVKFRYVIDMTALE